MASFAIYCLRQEIQTMPRCKQFDEEVVLDKAIEVFWEKGYNATSYSDLVKRMEINRASMYGTYGDKRQLFLKALQQYKAKNFDVLKKSLLRNIPLRQKMQEFFDAAIADILSDQSSKGCFIVNSTTELAAVDEEIAQFVEQNKKDLLAIFNFLFQEAQVNGEISEDLDPEALSHYIYNAYNGLRVTNKINPDEKALMQIKDLTLSVF